MRRIPFAPANNSTHGQIFRHKFDARLSIYGLQDRVTELERVVAELTDGSDILSDAVPVSEKKRPGPKRRYSGMLFLDRDQLIQMLESYWPEIEGLCGPSTNETGLKRVLSAVSKQLQGRYHEPAIHLKQNIPALIKFLSSDRFRSDPRQIANALAGVPSITTWRSLKLCQASRSDLPIGDRAIRAYLRRKHPELHGRLMADQSLTNFASALRSYRTNDAALKACTARSLYQSWKQCTADYISLGIASSRWR
jgi:hypothetical protein